MKLKFIYLFCSAKVKKDKENAALETADEFLMPKELYMEKIREIEKLKADVKLY